MRYQGQKDIPLNNTGRLQAKGNGRKLYEKIGKAEGFEFTSSPLSRTRETMEIIRTAMGLVPENYNLDDRLVEISYGDFEGKTKTELKSENRNYFLGRKDDAWHFRPKNGESQADALTRISQWYESLSPTKLYVVTAHGAIGRVLRHYLLDIPKQEAATFSFPQDEVFQLSKGHEIRF